ncbi:MAG TPA: helix-turn-helix transcriptional regulator [Capsulimonadaceae bacterium]|nr:helix-turn-helix transcriptional regulator [Capsulimonadaceae bacterium]
MGLNDLGRFSDPAMLVLTSLANSPKHGWAIMEDIIDFSGVRLGPGTLYGALARLERLGWIAALPAEERRRPYRITTAGHAVLREQLESLTKFTSMGLSRLQEGQG